MSDRQQWCRSIEEHAPMLHARGSSPVVRAGPHVLVSGVDRVLSFTPIVCGRCLAVYVVDTDELLEMESEIVKQRNNGEVR